MFRAIAVMAFATIAVCSFGQCSSNGNCTPGDTRVCTGPAACAGGQTCGQGGQWGACDCGGNDASIPDAAADAKADSASDATTDASDGSTCSVTDMTDTCDHICALIYDCGLVTCGTGAQLCPNFNNSSGQKNTWLDGDAGNNGCISSCGPNFTLLKGAVDPNDCQATISGAKAAFGSGFTAFCQ
jgi:hypothetical protein